MKRKLILITSLLVILSGCVSQDEHEALQADYRSLEEKYDEQTQEVSVLTERNEELEEAKALYDQNKKIIDDVALQEELTKDIALKEQEVSELSTRLDELKGDIQAEEEQIEKEKEEGVVLQDDDKVKLNYLSERNGTLTFYIENKTDTSFDIFPRYLSVNGTSYSDLYAFDVIAPNSSATFEVEIDGYSNSEDIRSLSGLFELNETSNFNDFHKLEFNDIAIRI